MNTNGFGSAELEKPGIVDGVAHAPAGPVGELEGAEEGGTDVGGTEVGGRLVGGKLVGGTLVGGLLFVLGRHCLKRHCSQKTNNESFKWISRVVWIEDRARIPRDTCYRNLSTNHGTRKACILVAPVQPMPPHCPHTVCWARAACAKTRATESWIAVENFIAPHDANKGTEVYPALCLLICGVCVSRIRLCVS